MTVVNKSACIVYVCVSLSLTPSLYRQWISGVRTSFKLSHSINTGSIDFFKQLMEAFRAGKLIKIICRSSSFKDSPLVYVEPNHAWLENPSIGHRNWLVFLMAFQCCRISEKESKFLWQISCWISNNPNTESLTVVAVSCVLEVSCQCLETVMCFIFHPLRNKQYALTEHAEADSTKTMWCLVCFNLNQVNWNVAQVE